MGQWSDFLHPSRVRHGCHTPHGAGLDMGCTLYKIRESVGDNLGARHVEQSRIFRKLVGIVNSGTNSWIRALLLSQVRKRERNLQGLEG